MISRRFLLAAVAAAALLTACGGPPVAKVHWREVDMNVPDVGVRIIAAADTVTLETESGFSLFSEWDRLLLGPTVIVRGGSKGVFITNFDGEVHKVVGEVSLQPLEEGGVIVCRGRTYAGRMVVVPGKGPFDLVNKLDIESYLKGVLPLEMGTRPRNEYQCLKAQAVAARSYALYKLRENTGNVLAASVMDQVYGGAGVRYGAADSAVDETRGEVLLHDGAVIKAYYSSTCGGRTQTPDMAWPGREPGSFASVTDTMCSISRHYRWEETWPRTLLDSILRVSLSEESGAAVPADAVLEDIRILGETPSGRIDTLAVTMGGQTYRTGRDRIRWVLRRPEPNRPILRSSAVSLAYTKGADGRIDTVRAAGRGNGHGVGMCQWGCINRARQSYDYTVILKDFYPNTVLGRAY